MKITRERLRLWGACYDDKRIAELVPEAGLTPLEIAALDIPVNDRLWVLLREDIIPARELRLLACGWAEEACEETGWNDERSLNAIAVARRFAFGEVSAAELAEAARAAWAAANEAEAEAEAEAAWSAAWSAARAADAARSAWAAARSSGVASEARARAWAWAAADWAASATARSAQLAAVVRALKG